MARQKLPSDEERIIASLRYGTPQVVVILFITSQDRKQKPLQDQAIGAGEAMDLFGQLYGGATAFQALDGVFRDDDGTLLHDQPILIESYVERQFVEDPARLQQLLDFARRMGKATRQAAVGVVIADILHLVRHFSPCREQEVKMSGLNHDAISKILGSEMRPVKGTRFGGFGILATTAGTLKARRQSESELAPKKFTLDQDRLVARAFDVVRDRASPDSLLWDKDLAQRFVERCRELGLVFPAAALVHRLLRIRKGSKE
jgi:hypothetical protein